MVSSVAFVRAYVCITYVYPIYIYIYTHKQNYMPTKCYKIFLHERLRSVYIILRNNGTGVPAR